MNKSEVVTLKVFESVGEAQVYQSLLESAGVPAYLQNDILASMLPTGGDLVAVKLVVAPEYEKRAREILSADFDHEQFRKESGIGGRRKKCEE